MSEPMSVELFELCRRLSVPRSPTFVDDLDRVWLLVMGAPLDKTRSLSDVVEELGVVISYRFREEAKIAAPPSRAEPTSRYRRALHWLDKPGMPQWWDMAVLLLFVGRVVPNAVRAVTIPVALILLGSGSWRMVRRRVRGRHSQRGKSNETRDHPPS